MKIKLTPRSLTSAGYALLIVLGFVGASLLILGGTLSRTATVAKLNDRNNDYIAAQGAAEAAVEKAYGWMALDFQNIGYSAVLSDMSLYQGNPPSTNEIACMGDFTFSDAQGNVGKTYVSQISTFSGTLPSAYHGTICVASPVYRIISNARTKRGVSAAVQEDVLLALVPLNTYAIFYNNLLEFSDCATMTVNGRVHCNTNIFVGTTASLTFNSNVTCVGTFTAPDNNGRNYATNANAYNGNDWGVYFGTNASYTTNSSSVTIAIPMTNTHTLIDIPPSGESLTNTTAKTRIFNLAQTQLIVSNTALWFKIQVPPSIGQLPAADATPTTLTYTNFSTISSNLPFLTLTNAFYDDREKKTNIVTQIDVGKYAAWLTTNSAIGTKFPTGGTTTNYPTILFVADTRATNGRLTVVRLTNGLALPKNNGLGWTVGTPNPLYVWGNYNCTNTAYLGTTNTSATVPSALMSDALTVLSSNWKDTNSIYGGAYSSGSTKWDAAGTNTINAAILTGTVPSTGTTTTTFSGGVQNLPRMLEDWSSSTLWLNTSIVNLYNSTKASNQWRYQGQYYNPPTRKWAFDPNFLNPAKQPPGVPCALVPIRYGWANPPIGTTTYTNASF